MLLWAVAALWYELQQISSRKTSRSAEQSFGKIFRAYLKSDPFNSLDLTALCACALLNTCCSLSDPFTTHHPRLATPLRCVLALSCSSILKLSAEAHVLERGGTVESGVGDEIEAGLAGVVASAEDRGVSMNAMTDANTSLGAVTALATLIY